MLSIMLCAASSPTDASISSDGKAGIDRTSMGVPLKEIVDLVLWVCAGGYSLARATTTNYAHGGCHD